MGRLQDFVSDARRRVFDDLVKGVPPSLGSVDLDAFAKARDRGKPQLGTTRFGQQEVRLEFIYPDSRAAAIVLEVHIPTPERVVFLPVPAWVVEQIWQGEVTGSYAFESDAHTLVNEFTLGLSADVNAKFF